MWGMVALQVLAACGLALAAGGTLGWEVCANSRHKLHSERCQTLHFVLCPITDNTTLPLLKSCRPPTLTVYMETFYYNHTRRRKGHVQLFPLSAHADHVPNNCKSLAAVRYEGNFKPDFAFDNYTFVLNEEVSEGQAWTTQTACGAEADRFPPIPPSDRVIHRLVADRVDDKCPLQTGSCEPLQLHGVPAPHDFSLHVLPSGEPIHAAHGLHRFFMLEKDRTLPLFVRWRGGQPAVLVHRQRYGFPHPSEQAYFFASLHNQEQIASLIVLPFNATLMGYQIAARFDSLGLQDPQTSNYSLSVHLVNYYGSADSLPGEAWFKRYWGHPESLTNLQEGCSRRCSTYHWGGVSQEPLGAPYPIPVWPHLNHHAGLEQTLVHPPLHSMGITVPGPKAKPALPCSSVAPEVMLAGLYRQPLAPGEEPKPLPDIINTFQTLTKENFVWEPQSCTGGMPQLSVPEILQRLQQYNVYSITSFGDSLSREVIEMMSDLVWPENPSDLVGLQNPITKHAAQSAHVKLTGGASTLFSFRGLHHGIDGANSYLGDAAMYSRALLKQLGFSESTEPAVIAQELAAAPDVSIFCPTMGYVPHTINCSFWAQVSDALQPHLANRFLHHPSPNKTFYIYIEPVPWARLDFNTPQRTRQLWEVMTSRLNLALTGTRIIDVSIFSESAPQSCNDGLHYYSQYMNWNPQAWTSVQYVYQQIFYDRRVRLLRES